MGFQIIRKVTHDYVIQIALTASFSLTTLSMSMLVLSIGEATYTAINRELECDYREAKLAGLPLWPFYARAAVYAIITRICESFKLLVPLFGAFFVFKGRSKGWKSSLKWALGAWAPIMVFQVFLGAWDIFRRVWPMEHSKRNTYINDNRSRCLGTSTRNGIGVRNICILGILLPRFRVCYRY